jgi:hypothetical protein
MMSVSEGDGRSIAAEASCRAMSTVRAADVAGPRSTVTTQPTATPLVNQATVEKFWDTNAAVHWDGVARTLVASNNSNALQAIRGYATVTLAQYNAAVAAGEGETADAHPSVHAAIAAASVVTLSYLYPAHAGALEAHLDQFLSGESWTGDRHTDAEMGEAIGGEIGAQVVARAMTDRFFAPYTGTLPSGPGVWFPAPNTTPGGAAVGQAKTFFLVSGNQFRPAPPPAFGSPEFAAALAEVRAISDTRTPAQVALAQFWNLPAGTHQPPGYWNEEATNLAVKYHLGERETAHMLALMNMVAYDAVVASHEAKYHYWLLRPTQADPGITLPIGLPNFPSYPSNHAAISAGMARVLARSFPAETERIDSLAEAAALSRVVGGIHYRFDGDAGVELGRKVAAWALARDVNGLRPFVLN